MKSLLKNTIILIFLCLWTNSFAQDYKVQMKTGKVKLHTLRGLIEVETHNSNELIIQSKSDSERRVPEAAAGLTRLTEVEDNTGLGLNVVQNGDVVEITSADKKSKDFKILIPERIALVAHLKSWDCKGLKVSNFKAELEIKSEYPSVTLLNVTGPVVLNATYGKVSVVFDNVNQTKPISILSAYQDVDVTLPENTKANLKLQSDYGEIFTDFNISRDKQSKTNDDFEAINTSFVSGTINGGGVEIYLKSPYKNIYLRKKK